MAQFVGVTAASDSTARFYLESCGGSVEAAVQAFFDSGGAEAPTGGAAAQAAPAQATPGSSLLAEAAAARAARAAAAGPSGGAGSGAGPSGSRPAGGARAGAAAGNVRSLGDIGGDEESDDEDDYNELYVGGDKRYVGAGFGLLPVAFLNRPGGVGSVAACAVKPQAHRLPPLCSESGGQAGTAAGRKGMCLAGWACCAILSAAALSCPRTVAHTWLLRPPLALLLCSGQVVRGAPKDKGPKGPSGGVEDIFEGARAAGAEQVCCDGQTCLRITLCPGARCAPAHYEVCLGASGLGSAAARGPARRGGVPGWQLRCS